MSARGTRRGSSFYRESLKALELGKAVPVDMAEMKRRLLSLMGTRSGDVERMLKAHRVMLQVAELERRSGVDKDEVLAERVRRVMDSLGEQLLRGG